MHNSQIRAFSLSTAAALLLTALPGVSDARTIPGSIGRAATPTDEACLILSSSAIVNTCARAVRVDFPLVHDASGTINARFRAQGPASSVACELVWTDGVSFAQSATGTLAAAGSPQLINLTVNGSFTTDSVFIGCTLQQNGRVHTVIN